MYVKRACEPKCLPPFRGNTVKRAITCQDPTEIGLNVWTSAGFWQIMKYLQGSKTWKWLPMSHQIEPTPSFVVIVSTTRTAKTLVSDRRGLSASISYVSDEMCVALMSNRCRSLLSGNRRMGSSMSHINLSVAQSDIATRRAKVIVLFVFNFELILVSQKRKRPV